MPTLNERQDLAKKSDLLTKQDTLIPGTGISIAADGKTISATGIGGSTVTVSPVLSTGTRVAAIEVDGTIYTLFAPTPPSVGVTQVVDQGVELARVTINGVATSIYAPESSTVLSGTSAPSSSLGENNNLYVQYTVENESYTVNMTYVKLNGEWVQLSAGGGGVTIPEHWSWTTDNLKAYLLAAPNEYGWAVGVNTYYFDTAKTWTIYNREFSRGDNGPVLLAGIYHDNRWFGTAAISTNQEATYFSYNNQGFGPYSYKGYDWYISGGNYSMEYGNYNGIAYYGAVTDGGFNSDEQRLNIIKAIVDASDLNPMSDDFIAINRDSSILIAGGGEEIDFSDATFKIMRNGDIIGNAFHGATTLADGTVGLVPAPLIADKDKFLKGDGTWAEGGGGNANQEELTWDEYEALTEEEKTNGTVYYITDADEIEPDKFRPVIYSEDEREIGVWTDGKPLYQKTAFVTPGNTISTVGLSLKHAQCYSISTSGGIIPVPYNDGSYICWWMSSDAIRFATGRSDISQYVITYQYTKDSDFAGSGKWTPQGVPAHHYSTDEHVIGTWVDGSTLYERTYTGISQTGYSDTTIVDADIKSNSGIYNVKSITGLWTIGGFGYSDATIQAFGETGIFNGGSQTLYARVTPNGLAVVRTNTNFGYGAFLTVRYTKTTS